MQSARAIVPWLFSALLLPQASALCQMVQGHVLESGSEEPIVLAEVTLLDTAMTVVDQTFSAHDGAFELHAPGPGSFYVRAGAMGYRTKLDGVVELAEGGLLPVLFFLAPEPIEVEGIQATAEARRMERFLESQGFYERREEGFGLFITPEEIEVRNVRDYIRMFQLIPQVDVTSNATGTYLELKRCYRSRRPPALWVDGTLVDVGWNRGKIYAGGLEDVVQVSDVLAVEVYQGPATTPMQWAGTNLMKTCGTVVIWTKGG